MAWVNLGLGALVGALVGAISTHLLRERAEVRREERELRGLLRLVSAELTINDRTMEMLLHNHGGSHGDFEDAAWKHANVRLAQFLGDEHHFHHLNMYYRNNANVEGLAFEMSRLRLDLAEPNNFPARTVKMILEQQLEMSRIAQQFISEYVPDAPYDYGHLTFEVADEAVKQLDPENGGPEKWKRWKSE